MVYREVYKGVDVKFYGNNRLLEYDIIVKPGADPSMVRLSYEGIEGLQVTESGDLYITMKEGGIIQKKPYVYQEIEGKRVEIDGRFRIIKEESGFAYGFDVASYSKDSSLVIDPVLVYSTYLGGSMSDYGWGIAVDSLGNAYVTGWTYSTNFPTTTGAYDTTYNGYYDIFIAKIGDAAPNLPPIASAGPDQSIHAGSIATLDGSGSTDPDGNYPLTYAWVITSMPSGSAAILSNPAAVNPSFTADKTGDFIATLTVTDSLGAASAVDSVLISTSNTPPVADAGPDQSVVVIGSTVQLNGAQSYDLDGDPIGYLWTFTQKPSNSVAALSNAASAAPTFTADVHGDYTAQLVVSDPWASSAPDSVTVSFSNIKPVANSGGNQSVVAGNMVVLSGGGSTDANGDPLTYSWSLVTVPSGSAAVLSGANTDMASFIADAAGAYVVSLVVNDGFVNSDPSNASITAISSQTAATAALNEAIWVINHLGAEAFKNKNLANALTNKINAVLTMIDNGEYANAVDKLSSDILAKTDGCAIEGAPDKNDWLITCAAQGQLYPLIIEAIGFLK